MKTSRFGRLVTSTALGVILMLATQPGQAQTVAENRIDAAVPVPDTILPPPLTAKDIAPAPKHAAAAPAMTPSQIDAAVPVPDTSVPPPLTAADIGATTPATSKQANQSTIIPTAAPSQAATQDSKPTTAATAAAKVAPAQNAATKPASQTASAPVPPTADSAVADRLRDMVTGRLDRIVPRRDDRAGVEAFYRSRDYKPLWVSGGHADARAQAAMGYLANSAADGLNPDDYPLPDFKSSTTASELAEDELKLTNSVLIYARDAQIGRIHFSRVGSDIAFKLVPPQPEAVLKKLAETKDVAAALDSYNPPQAGFRALKAKLAELRKGTLSQHEEKQKLVRVDAGPILRPGMRGQRVVQLRQRLKIGDTDNPLYDRSVTDAVKAFQMQVDIAADGMVGPATLRALNGQRAAHRRPRDPIETVIVNMERWRWLPRKLSNDQGAYVMVNEPDYTLKLMFDGKVYWKTKIVVGKPSKATPMISAEMKYITVNPTWNVPPSIIENEYLPALREDPNALDRIGLKIRQDPDGTVHIFQPPGAGNALGRIRFNFPNKFLVYQHDTPDKYLFKRAKRAYSHGCMRVQDPVEYATKLLSIELPQEHYTPARIESMFGGNEININFPHPIPVHLTYQTAFVDQNGKLEFRDDVYGRDARMIAILDNAKERRIAYIPVERPPNTSSRPVRLPVGALAGDGGYVGNGYDRGYEGGGFFDWLFGGATPEPPRQYYRQRRPGFIGPGASDNGRWYSRR